MVQLAFDRQTLKKGLQQALGLGDAESPVVRGRVVSLDQVVEDLVEALKELKRPQQLSLVGEESERREGGVPGLEKDD